jgi:hypothetical protein
VSPLERRFPAHLTDLRVQRLQVYGWERGSVAAAGTENIGSPSAELGFPLYIWIDVELLRSPGQRSITLDRSKRAFALKADGWFRRGDRSLFLQIRWHGVPSGRNSTCRPAQISEATVALCFAAKKRPVESSSHHLECPLQPLQRIRHIARNKRNIVALFASRQPPKPTLHWPRGGPI